MKSETNKSMFWLFTISDIMDYVISYHIEKPQQTDSVGVFQSENIEYLCSFRLLTNRLVIHLTT